MSGSTTHLTIGKNDQADGANDLIVSFVDGYRTTATDGTRTVMPGSGMGCYVSAADCKPIAGCVVTVTPA